MIRVFHRIDSLWQTDSWEKPGLPSRNIWIDLVSPSPEEISQVQKHLSIEIPSRPRCRRSSHQPALPGKRGLLHDGHRNRQP